MILVAIVVLAAVVSPVYGERFQSGNLIIFLNGGISPRVLPRDHSAPVSVRLQGGIRSSEHIPLPRVKQIRLELAYRGALDTEGLPVCPKSRLQAAEIPGALAVCGSSLVGKGKLYARIFLPNQAPFGLHARLFAFNGRNRRSQPAVWVLAYSENPPVSIILPFYVAHQRGPFHTVLVSVVPRDVGPWPHFARFNIVVSRDYHFRGQTHSYLRAACPLPPRFTSGLLSLARATFIVDEGPELDVETVRTCRAK